MSGTPSGHEQGRPGAVGVETALAELATSRLKTLRATTNPLKVGSSEACLDDDLSDAGRAKQQSRIPSFED